MNTGTLTQVPESADPARRMEPPQAHPGSLDVLPCPWSEPSTSLAWLVLPSPQHTLAFSGTRRWLTDLARPADTFSTPHHRRYSPIPAHRVVSLAIPPPGLPTGSKTDASFETTGELDDKLDRITDPHVCISLRLQVAFGLCREKSIRFQPHYADRNEHFAIEGSWAKGVC